jgi:DNA-binding transcriptional LysR family regulator
MPTAPEPAIGDLRALVRAVETGSLSAVARERDVPASQVSRAIDRLEDIYGVKLLRRSTHGLSITAEGEVLLDHARRLLETVNDLSSDLTRQAGNVAGVVRVSVSPVLASAQLVPSLPKLQARHPDLQIDLVIDDRLVDLAAEGIDVAVRAGKVDSGHIVARQIGDHGRAIFAAPSYLASYGMPNEPGDLHRHRCISHMANGTLNRWPFIEAGKRREVAIAGTHRVNSTAMLAEMVLAGVGIARLNTTIVAPWVRAGRLQEVLAEYRDTARFPIYAVMLPDRRRLARVKAVVEHIAQVFKAQPSVMSLKA